MLLNLAESCEPYTSPFIDKKIATSSAITSSFHLSIEGRKYEYA